MGTAQWLVLRRSNRRARWWILASAVGGMLLGPVSWRFVLGAIGGFGPTFLGSVLRVAWFGVQGLVLYGLISAIAFGWLLRDRAR